MGSEAGNFVTQALATADGNLGEEALVALEIESETGVVFLDEEAGGLLDGLGADTTLQDG